MITLRVWFVVLSMATLLAGGTVWSAMVHPATSFQLGDLNATFRDLLAADPVPVEPRIDIYGNEIQDAVGDYRVDPGGDVYENHAPDTEVPRLTGAVM